MLFVPVKDGHQDHETDREQRPRKRKERHRELMSALAFGPGLGQFIHIRWSKEGGIILPHSS